MHKPCFSDASFPAFYICIFSYLWYFSPALILKERYICSRSITRISWWGKVKSEKERRRSAAALTSSLKPLEPPIIKQMSDLPSSARQDSFSARPSEQRRFPLTSSAITYALFGIRLIMEELSSFTLSDLLCASSQTVSLQNRPSLFAYSAQASCQYFSFSFPMQIIEIFIGIFYHIAVGSKT